MGQVGRKRWKISRVGEEEELCQICDGKESRNSRKNPEHRRMYSELKSKIYRKIKTAGKLENTEEDN